jgi:hypothetical protein
MPEFPDVLATGGIAAVVAGAVVLVLRRTLETGLEARLQRIRAELDHETAYVREAIKRQTESYPGLAEAIYRTRNLSRGLMSALPVGDPSQRSDLGDLTVQVTEILFQTRAYLPRPLFEPLHRYKTHLQNFLLYYDRLVVMSDSDRKDSAGDLLSVELEGMNGLAEDVIEQIQRVLKVR